MPWELAGRGRQGPRRDNWPLGRMWTCKPHTLRIALMGSLGLGAAMDVNSTLAIPGEKATAGMLVLIQKRRKYNANDVD